ncbi:fertilization-influencing membrane protein [Erinaceus europaeus]|uniref:Fertilization-influencing membrane protein n=1 Tax=Erinaceus europaeus TaxID=9365 RepID=A0ABM3W0I4_ERIEU|nr:fertilization-influencing membrane protein [Erinaceus europaeus]
MATAAPAPPPWSPGRPLSAGAGPGRGLESRSDPGVPEAHLIAGGGYRPPRKESSRCSPRLSSAHTSRSSIYIAVPSTFCLGLQGWCRGCWALVTGLYSVSPAPSVRRAESLVLGAETTSSLDQREFFDYPDSDQVQLLAVAQFIGERPVLFVDSSSRVFNHILVGVLVAAFLFIFFQFCTHLSCQKGA